MRPFRNLIRSIPLSENPSDHRTFIAGIERLPQDDRDVQSTLHGARRELSRTENASFLPDQATHSGRLAPDTSKSATIDDPDDPDHEDGYYLIKAGPPVGVPLQQHLDWIRRLKAMPQDHREVRDALRRAYEVMERSERFRANKERRLRGLPSLRS